MSHGLRHLPCFSQKLASYLTPTSDLRPPPHQNPRHQSQHRCHTPQQTPRPLKPQIHKQRMRYQRKRTSTPIPTQPNTRQRRRRIAMIHIRRIVKHRQKHSEDTHGHDAHGDDG